MNSRNSPKENTSRNRVVLVVGSMNCMPTAYAELLAKRGYSTKHYADCDVSDLQSNPLIRQPKLVEVPNLALSLLRFWKPLYFLFPKIFHKELMNELRGADLIFLSGASISLAKSIKSSTDKAVVALGYGDDISVFCNKSWPEIRFRERGTFSKVLFGWIVFLLHKRLVDSQRAGLRKCTHLAYFPPGFDKGTDSIIKEVIRESDVKRVNRYSISLLELPVMSPTKIATVSESLKVIFPVRFTSSTDLFVEKGWRIFIEGVAEYFKVQPTSNTRFYCFNKGDMVASAKTLARSLEIHDKIEWLTVVPFEKLYSYLNDSDVVVDQLGDQFPGLGMWGAHLGKTVISNLSISGVRDFYLGSGFLNASKPAEFAAQIVKCESAELRERLGSLNHTFVANKLDLEKEFETWNICM